MLNRYRNAEGMPFMFYVRASSPENARDVARAMFLRLDEVLNERPEWRKGDAFAADLVVLPAQEEAKGERKAVME